MLKTQARKNRELARVAAMKEQTFGVEVEMNGVTRYNAARAAAKFFGTNRFEDTAYRNGYYTWSAYDAQGREWKFSRDVSIHGPDGKKCEMVTPILHYDDMETLQELVRVLRKKGAKSCPSEGCGVHIHIGADGHTPQTLLNLTNIMASHERLFIDALNIDHTRTMRYCSTVDPNFLRVVNEKKPKTMDEFADVWYTTQHANYGRNQHYNSSRYHMLNYHATFTKGTIEFRLFQFDEADPATGRKGGLHAGQLKAYIQLCLMLSQFAKDSKSNSPVEPQHENPKYAMRMWLKRMGFNGDEFETLRQVMTQRLPGDCAFRHGDPRGNHTNPTDGAGE